MNRYEEVLKEIKEVECEIAHAKDEILDYKTLIDTNDMDLISGWAPRWIRDEIKEQNGEYRAELSWWYDEKKSLYERLNKLKAEKQQLEDLRWRSKICKTKNCGNIVRYLPEWEHVPNYCPDCKKRFNRS